MMLSSIQNGMQDHQKVNKMIFVNDACLTHLYLDL